MNTGLQDVHNLCWKLAGVLHGWAAPALLDTYTAERRPVAVFNAGEAVLNFRSHNARDKDGNPIHFRREHFVHPGLSLGFRYNTGAIVPEPGQDSQATWVAGHYEPDAIPGARAPHVWLRDDCQRKSTTELFGDRFILLGAVDSPAVAAGLLEAQKLRVPVAACTIGPGALHACDERWATLYGLGGDGLVIVRPDGHVGARWRDAPSAEALAQAWYCLTGVEKATMTQPGATSTTDTQ